MYTYLNIYIYIYLFKFIFINFLICYFHVRCSNKHITKDYTEWLLQSKLSDDDRQKISSKLQKTLTKFRLLCRNGEWNTLRHSFGENVEGRIWRRYPSRNQLLVSEMVPWKMDVCKGACEKRNANPKFINQTGDEAKETTPCGSDIAVLALECDDASKCSSTQRSILDGSGKSGASFLQFIAYLQSVAFEGRPNMIVTECVSALGKLKQEFQKECDTEVVRQKLLEEGPKNRFHELKSANFFLSHNRSRVYRMFKKMSSFGQAGQDAVLAQVDETLNNNLMFHCCDSFVNCCDFTGSIFNEAYWLTD